MEGSEEADDTKGVLPSTETDGAPSNQNKAPMTEEQWSGIKGILEHIYNYRDEE